MRKDLRESVPQHSQSVQWREFGPEAVLVDTRTGDYAQLNQTGVLIWKAVDGLSSVHDIAVRLAPHFEARPHELEDDIASFVEDLLQKGLLSICA